MVMVNNVETMTKRNPHHLVKALVGRHQNKEDLDWDIVFCMKTKTSNKEGNDSFR
jgi:hypothetical protein